MWLCKFTKFQCFYHKPHNNSKGQHLNQTKQMKTSSCKAPTPICQICQDSGHSGLEQQELKGSQKTIQLETTTQQCRWNALILSSCLAISFSWCWEN